METTIQDHKSIDRVKSLDVIGYWTCDACGGDSESGCLMSDPEDCVKR